MLLSGLNSFSQTQYDYYGYRGVAGGTDRALNGIIIMVIIVIIAIVLLFFVAGVLKVYYTINPSADPEIQRQRLLDKKQKYRKAVLEEKRASAFPIAIDLGLSVKWASLNLGAYCRTDIGTLITWGNNLSDNPRKITDANEVGEYTGNIDYDAASYKLGHGWRVPTEKECEELITKCKWEYHEESGVKGFLVIGPSGNNIFLPYNQSDSYNGPYTYAAYWTSTPTYSRYGTSQNAKDLRISPKSKPVISVWSGATAKRCHFGIRAVFGDIPNKIETIVIDDKKTSDIETIFEDDTCIDELIYLSKIQESDDRFNKETTIVDEFNVVYSKDGRRLIDAGDCTTKEYSIKEGTEVICENAFTPKGILNFLRYDSVCRVVEIPCSVKYIGLNALQTNCDYINSSPFYEIQGPLLIDLRKRSILKCIDTHITRLIIEEGIISIEAHAFLNCREVTEVRLPQSLLTIKESAFMGCEKLKYINIPNGLRIIEDSTFFKCSSLNNIDLNDNIHTIERCAFGGCESLEIMSLPRNLMKIGDRAFCRCKSISANLPNSLNELGDAPFTPINSNLTSESCRYKIINDLLIDVLNNELIQIVKQSNKNIIVPHHILSIKNYAFAGSGIETVSINNPSTQLGSNLFLGCKELIHIDLPINLKEIPSYTFAWCDSLENISIPTSVESIGVNSFYYCKKLSNITLGNNLRRIERSAFEACENLLSIDIPFSVEYIVKAFENSGVKILNFNACNAEINCSMKPCIQINIGELVEVLPKGLFANVFMKKIIVPENVKLIKKDCFKGTIMEELYIDSTDIKFEEDWISDYSLLQTIYIRAEIYQDILSDMPSGVKIKKIYPHHFLFFRW